MVEGFGKEGKRKLEFTFEDVVNYARPIVYTFIRDGKCIYVGMSVDGIGRPLSHSHKMRKIIKPGDKLEIIFVDTAIEATWLEKAMIEKFEPIHNDLKWYQSIGKRKNMAAALAQMERHENKDHGLSENRTNPMGSAKVPNPCLSKKALRRKGFKTYRKRRMT